MLRAPRAADTAGVAADTRRALPGVAVSGIDVPGAEEGAAASAAGLAIDAPAAVPDREHRRRSAMAAAPIVAALARLAPAKVGGQDLETARAGLADQSGAPTPTGAAAAVASAPTAITASDASR